MARVKNMSNPLDGSGEKMLTHEETLYVRKLRRVRNGASKMSRSGHPGRRADAFRALAEVPAMIHKVYADNLRGVKR